MSKKLRLAFIGGGINSAIGRIHKVASEMDSRFQLVCGSFSRNQETSLASALEYGLSESDSYAGWEDLLAARKDSIDAAVILTPPSCRLDAMLGFIRAGVPVICEKPLADNLPDARLLAEEVAARGAFAAVTFNYTGYPMVREMREIVRSGRLGKLLNIMIEMPQESFIRKAASGDPLKTQAWRLADGDIPTVSLDLGVHLHSMVHFLTGQKPQSVTALESNMGNFQGIVDHVTAICRYSADLQVNFWYGKACLGNRNGFKIRVFGTEGSMEWFQLRPDEIIINDNQGNRSMLDRGSAGISIANQPRYMRFKPGHPDGFLEAFSNYYYDLSLELNHFRQHGTMTHDTVPAFPDVITGLELMHAIHRSGEERTWINI